MQFKPDKLPNWLVLQFLFYWSQFVIKTAVIFTFVSTFKERYEDVRVIIPLERTNYLSKLIYTAESHKSECRQIINLSNSHTIDIPAKFGTHLFPGPE